jgi:hypothetical protein
METTRAAVPVRLWSRFADGVLAAAIGHGLMVTYGICTAGLEAAVPWAWLLFGVAQLVYVVPLLLAFAITGRPAAVLGVAAAAAATAAPLFVIRLTGGLNVLPF